MSRSQVSAVNVCQKNTNPAGNLGVLARIRDSEGAPARTPPPPPIFVFMRMERTQTVISLIFLTAGSV